VASGGPSRPGKHSARPGGQPAGPAGGAQPHGGARPAGGPGPWPGGGFTDRGGPGPRGDEGVADADSQPDADADAGERADAAREQAEAAAAEARTKLAERTADLQRLQAEYANYRKRVERDRMAMREQALANVLNELVPVLDDIGRAREHGELVGGFKSVGESLEGIAAKLGLTSFGEAGDPFDPMLHEALMHSYSPDVTEPTAVQILQPGYKVGERIIRPARVAVAEPGGDAAGPEGYATRGGAADGGDRDEAGPDDASRLGEAADGPDDTAG
jgi:molecular chaperone GrpE